MKVVISVRLMIFGAINDIRWISRYFGAVNDICTVYMVHNETEIELCV